MTDVLLTFYGLVGLNVAVLLTGAILAGRGILRAALGRPRPRKETSQ